MRDLYSLIWNSSFCILEDRKSTWGVQGLKDKGNKVNTCTPRLIGCLAILWFFFLLCVPEPLCTEYSCICTTGDTLELVSHNDPSWGPWDGTGWSVGEPAKRDALEHSKSNVDYVLQASVTAMIRVFQRFVSPVDGPSCSFFPTCSSYAMYAIKKHGLFIGIPMATERMARNHNVDTFSRYQIITVNDSFYYYDPVEANDYWWCADHTGRRATRDEK